MPHVAAFLSASDPNVIGLRVAAVRRSGGAWRAAGPASVLCLALCLALSGAAAHAEKADRTKPMVVESDQGGSVDLQRQVLIYRGNVVLVQGSMVLRADRLELREAPDGYRTATAFGAAGKPATWRQKRDGVDETMEGVGERIDFDGRADTLRLTGNSTVRRLRGGTVADEITGATVLWENATEIFRVEGGNASTLNPGGRVRAVLSPRATSPAAAASAPADGGALQPSRGLGTGR